MALQDQWPGEVIEDDEVVQDVPAQLPTHEVAPDTAPQSEADPYDAALEGIVNEIDVPEQDPGIDRSNVIAVADPGKGDVTLSTEVKTVKSPWLSRHGAQLGRMLASNATDADILDFAKEAGAPANELNIQEALNFRHSPQFREWKRQNPNAPYPINESMEVPLDANKSALGGLSNEKEMAQMAATPGASMAAGALDTMTLGFADELAGLAGADTEEFRLKQELSAAANPTASVVGQLAGGAVLPTRALAVGKGAAQAAFREALAGGVARAEARQIAKDAARKAIIAASAKEGAAYGGAYGAGSAEGDLGDRAAAGAIGALAGGAGGAAVSTLGTKLVGRGGGAVELTPQRQAAQAAERLGMDLLPADAGGPMTRRATSVASQTIAGGQPIIKAAEKINDQAQGVRDRIASAVGEAFSPEAAGQRVIEGAKVYRNSSRDEARVFYSGAEKATKDFKATPTKALDVLDRNIAELGETPGGAAGLSTLKGIREDLANGKTGVAGIRNMRTALRDQFAATGLRGSDLERRTGQVVDAAAEDVANSLRDAGKGEAARLFESGDRAWKARAKTIDTVLEPIIGKDGTKSGEKVVQTLMADLQSNNARAVKLLNTLPEAEQNNLRASIIGGLGRSTKGAQNAEGDAFSLSRFLTNWNEIGETAKRAYFGPEARAALNDLAKIAEVTKEAQGYLNRSNTGGVLGNLLTLSAGVGGIPSFVATVGAQYGVGRLLASPKFARWLARAPKTSLSGPAYVDRLSRIAAAEPAIATDILGLQQRLQQAFSASTPTRLAADEAGNGALGVPQGESQNSQDYPGEELP